MDSRRNFLGKMASGLAVVAAPSAVLGASDRIRFGVIGVGDRGIQITREALSCPNTELIGLADIYAKRLDDAKALAPSAKTYLDYRYLLDDKTIDAVLIATPHHLHCEHFVASLAAGKHVYQEKTMAFNVDHAKQMRTAYASAGRRTVQIGHHWTSFGQMADAIDMLNTGYLGEISTVHCHMYRNTPHGKPQWARPVYPDMNAENIIWRSFLGDAPKHEFDANRYRNWRFFWDYSGGNVHENMSHQYSFWMKALNLQIPLSATMTGGLYLWKDGREVPDTMSVSLEQPEEMLFTWDSGFGSSRLGVTEEVLGADGSISKTQQSIRYYPEKMNRSSGTEIAGERKSQPAAHMRNFFDCIRTGAVPNCPFEIGFRSSIACRMAVESYRQGRTIRWNPATEELV